MDKIWVLKASGKLKDKEVFAKNKGSDTLWNKIQAQDSRHMQVRFWFCRV